MAVLQSSGVGRILSNAGAPVTGTDAIQTITFGGTPTGGTFKLAYDSQVTANITWVAVNATLQASIDSALEALTNIGTGGVTVAVGTAVAGIGTFTITFTGAVGKLAVSTITVAANALTGTSPTVAVATTTPGVTATGRGSAKGKLMADTTNGTLYQNTGTTTAPTWTSR